MEGTFNEFISLCDNNNSHVRRVAEYSKILARQCGLQRGQVNLIYLAAPMHDIGKLGIADVILNKPGKLLNEEFDLMKEHCRIGYEMLNSLERPLMKVAAIIALEHHEKFDGSGYPNGLKGVDIHLFARIVAIADVFDALGTERCYKKAWDYGDILKFMVREKRRHFDPDLVDLFLENLDEVVEVREKY